MKPCVIKNNIDLTHSTLYCGLNFEGEGSCFEFPERSYKVQFQSPKGVGTLSKDNEKYIGKKIKIIREQLVVNDATCDTYGGWPRI